MSVNEHMVRNVLNNRHYNCIQLLPYAERFAGVKPKNSPQLEFMQQERHDIPAKLGRWILNQNEWQRNFLSNLSTETTLDGADFLF